ncbi:MAG: NAD(P)H-binding protein [Deltaproteobacteria bacterium]
MTTLALPRILVIGASGMLGAPVTRALVEAGFTVKTLAHGAGKPIAGTTSVQGDVFDRESLVSAMRDTDGVYLNLGIPVSARETDRLTEREGIANALAAAQTAGVRRVAMLSPLFKAYQGTRGHDSWVLRTKLAAERALMESPVPWTVFRASSFYENLEGGMRRGDKVSIMGKHWRPQRYLAAKDYGSLVAAALATEDSARQVLVAQGPEAMNLEALGRRYVAARTREKLEVQKAPLGVMKFVGLFSRELGAVTKMMVALDDYEEPNDAAATWARYGAPTMTVEQFAAR